MVRALLCGSKEQMMVTALMLLMVVTANVHVDVDVGVLLGNV